MAEILPDDERVCAYCLADLASDERVCPECGEVQPGAADAVGPGRRTLLRLGGLFQYMGIVTVVLAVGALSTDIRPELGRLLVLPGALALVGGSVVASVVRGLERTGPGDLGFARTAVIVFIAKTALPVLYVAAVSLLVAIGSIALTSEPAAAWTVLWGALAVLVSVLLFSRYVIGITLALLGAPGK